MADDPAPLLRRSGQEARHVDECDERDVERVTGADEARSLFGGADVEHAGERLRLVPHDADALPAEAGKAADDVLGVERLDLEELAVVDDRRDDALDVVRLGRLVGDEAVELRRLPFDRIGRLVEGRGVRVRLRQEAEQIARVLECRGLVGCDQVGNAGL